MIKKKSTKITGLNFEMNFNTVHTLYVMLVHSGVPELVYECQGHGHVRSTMAIVKKNEEDEACDTSRMNNFRLTL